MYLNKLLIGIKQPSVKFGVAEIYLPTKNTHKNNQIKQKHVTKPETKNS